jgi:predicted ATPase
MALYESQRHSPTVSDITQDPRVHCLANVAEVLWLRGYPDQALQHSQEAYTVAQRLAHPYSQVVALASATLVHSWRGEHRGAVELAEALIALAREHGFPHWLAVGTIRRGVAAVAQGQPEAGIAQIRQGLAALQATGAQLGLPGYWCQLARAYKAMGQEAEGLALIDEALARVHSTGERLLEAELYRLKGELLQLSSVSRPVCTDMP